MDIAKDLVCAELYCDKYSYGPRDDCEVSKGISSSCLVYSFTHDYCAAFAIALHKEFENYDLLCIEEDWPIDEIKTESTPPKKLIHAFCRNPYNEDNVFDARGNISLKYLFNVVLKNKSLKDVDNTTEDRLMEHHKNKFVKKLDIIDAQAFIQQYMEIYSRQQELTSKK